MVIGTLALLWYFVMVAVMGAGQQLVREPEATKSCRTRGICMYGCMDRRMNGWMDGWMDVQTDIQISPGLCLLRFPLEPLPKRGFWGSCLGGLKMTLLGLISQKRNGNLKMYLNIFECI